MASSLTSRRARFWIVAGFAVVLVGLVALVRADAAPAQSASIIGQPNKAPKPNCPRACIALGSVTGFQTSVRGQKNPFRIPRAGDIVAFRVAMGNPNRQARQFFGEIFGTPALGQVPTARIAVLNREEPGRFKLVRQSPIVDLSGNYGGQTIITLNEPLRVQRGHILALTTQTWIPNMVAANRIGRSKWRASRQRGRCGPKAAREANPHNNVGVTRAYRCNFADRLLYWGYFVPRS